MFVEKEGRRERNFAVVYAMLTFAKSFGMQRRSCFMESCAGSPAHGRKRGSQRVFCSGWVVLFFESVCGYKTLVSVKLIFWLISHFG